MSLKNIGRWILVAVLLIIAVIAGIVVLRTLMPSSESTFSDDNSVASIFSRATPTPEPTPEPTPTPTPTPTPPPRDNQERAERYVAQMSLEEKLGQMALFGFSGTGTPDEEFAAIQRKYQVGNFILYGANINKTDEDGGFAGATELVSSAKEGVTTTIPPFIAIDVEGGTVVRFTWTDWPAAARTLGNKADPTFAYDEFYAIGKSLMNCGINLDLAPVLDVAKDPMETFLKTRIISSDTEIASMIGTAIIEGLHETGCLAAAKHFPGHGGTDADSHETTPVVDKTLDEMLAYDLVPFSAAITAGVDAMLVAHISYPALDSTDIASMSEPIITGLLREQMGFTGLVISDDFRMGGLTSRYDVGEAAVKFINAGGNLILCGIDAEKQEKIMSALLTAAQNGTLSEERINECVQLILEKKYDSGVWPTGE